MQWEGHLLFLCTTSGMRITSTYGTSLPGAEGSFQCGQAKNPDYLKLVSHKWMVASICENLDWEVSSYTDLCLVQPREHFIM